MARLFSQFRTPLWVGILILSLLMTAICPAAIVTRLQRLMGLSWASESVAEEVLEAVLEGALLRTGQFKVNLRAKSPKALLNRELESLTVTGKELVLMEGIPIQNVSVVSLAPDAKETTPAPLKPLQNTPLKALIPHAPLVFTRQNPVQLVYPARFNTHVVLHSQALNGFLASKLGERWLAEVQKGWPLPIQQLSVDFSHKQVSMTGGVAPFGLGIIRVPVRVQATPITTANGTLRLEHPRVEVIGIKDSGELARLANRLFVRLVDLSHLSIEHHDVELHYTAVSAAQDTLSAKAVLTVTPPDEE